MTQFSLDYPDYVRVFASTRDLLYVKLSSNIAAPEQSGVIACGNLPYIGFKLLGQLNAVSINIEWFFDSAGTQLSTNDVIDIRQGVTFDQTIPVKGVYVRFTATPFGGANSTYTLAVFGSATPYTSNETNRFVLLDQENPRSIAPGVTGPVALTRMYAGLASWTHFSTALDWVVQLEYIAADGTVRHLLRINQNTPTGPQFLMLAPMPMQITYINNDAAAKNFYHALTGRAFNV
ncbi:MAG TPA: hypothetical protein VFU23_10985 [Gemmatimonadales bacterium]|nr:hypothetical protein [Gemmatimonadales bacterium]